MFLLVALQPTPSTSARDLTAGVTAFSDFLLQYLTPLIAVGALAMALIELWKKMFDTRTKFHARRWFAWMKEAYANAQPGDGPDHPVHAPLAQLLQLCTGTSPNEAGIQTQRLIAANGELGWSYGLFGRPRSPVYAVFGLELERMMGSIQEAADTVLANPSKYKTLYQFLTIGAEDEDVRAWLGDERAGTPGGPIAVAKAVEAKHENEIRALSEVSSRLRQVVKGKLDGFQLYTSDRWANRNQLWANIVGIVLMFITLEYNHWTTGTYTAADFRDFVTSSRLPLVLIGGILSPLAKDLVSALQRVKNG